MRRILLSLLLLPGAALAQAPQQIVQDAMQKQQAGDLEGAVSGYRQFLKIHPEATPIHQNLAVALAGLGRFEEAIPECKTALRQSPLQPTLRLNLARVYYKMGRLGDAVARLTRVHTEDPANLQAVHVLGDC